MARSRLLATARVTQIVTVLYLAEAAVAEYFAAGAALHEGRPDDAKANTALEVADLFALVFWHDQVLHAQSDLVDHQLGLPSFLPLIHYLLLELVPVNVEHACESVVLPSLQVG